MSREWRRVPADTLCGYCAPQRIIAKGEPALFTKLPNVKRERVRCQDCAGEAPPDLPERLEVRDISEMSQRGFTSVRDKAKEWMPYSEDL